MCWWALNSLSAPAEKAIRVPNMLSWNLLQKEKQYLLSNSVIRSWVDSGSTPCKFKQTGAALGQVQPKLTIVLQCFRHPKYLSWVQNGFTWITIGKFRYNSINFGKIIASLIDYWGNHSYVKWLKENLDFPWWMKEISYFILLTVELFIILVHNCKEIHIIPKLLWKVQCFPHMNMGKLMFP